MMFILLVFLWLLSYMLMEKKGVKLSVIVGRLIYLSMAYCLLSFFLWRYFNRALFNVTAWFILTPANALNGVLCLFAVLLLFNLLQLYYWAIGRKHIYEGKSLTKGQWVSFGLLGLFGFVGSLLFTSSYWAMHDMGNVRFDQIVYLLSQPLQGADPNKIYEFISGPLFSAVCFTVFLLSFIYFISTRQISNKMIRKHSRILIPSFLALGILSLLGGFSLAVKQIGYADVKAYYFEDTKIFDDHYVDPKEIKLTFPKKKRNLIYIYLESMESSYASKDNGGIERNDLIPNLTRLGLKEGINFSNSDKLGGAMQIPGANQTAGAMVAQTSGAPLKSNIEEMDVNQYGDNVDGNFFPGVYSLGQVLQKENYNQMLMIGSKAEFAGRQKYFEQHGNYTIHDYHWAIDQGLIPKDYYKWWGYEDDKLFSYAKDALTDLSNKKEPFNFTMLTTDTHFENGYATKETPDLFNDQYSNVIHYSDQKVGKFIEWIKQQPFYQDTTVVIVGDHLTMDKDFFDDADPNYTRSIYNVFLNTDKNDVNNKNRLFSNVDLYPTTLSALDVKIDGDQLGLGVDLFSSKKTLMEQMGYKNFYDELNKRSNYYNKYLMEGSDYDTQRKKEKN